MNLAVVYVFRFQFKGARSKKELLAKTHFNFFSHLHVNDLVIFLQMLRKICRTRLNYCDLCKFEPGN